MSFDYFSDTWQMHNESAFPDEEPTYLVRRFCFDTNSDWHRVVIDSSLTLEEAQEHCNDPETSSQTASDDLGIDGPWFDGYEEE